MWITGAVANGLEMVGNIKCSLSLANGVDISKPLAWLEEHLMLPTISKPLARLKEHLLLPTYFQFAYEFTYSMIYKIVNRIAYCTYTFLLLHNNKYCSEIFPYQTWDFLVHLHLHSGLRRIQWRIGKFCFKHA